MRCPAVLETTSQYNYLSIDHAEVYSVCLPACMSCGVVLGRFYQRENAPGDAPYWRGYVWAPINYLALQSLHHYAHSSLTPPATAQRAQEMYSELRTNLLDTILGSYHQTGFYWEQYATYF